MNIKTQQNEVYHHPDLSKSAELNTTQQTQLNNPYAGLTLMQYFKMNSKQGLQEIDEESNSSISAGTPYFPETKEPTLLGNFSKLGRRDKIRTQSQQLFPFIKQAYDHAITKITTITFNQTPYLDKNIVKLPSINDQRQINNSRAGMIKDGKVISKKQMDKGRSEDTSYPNNTSLSKQNEKLKIHDFQRNAILMKKSLRARVTSTSFYQPHTKEKDRERNRTEEQTFDKTLEKSFIVTKYMGLHAGTKRSKDQTHLRTFKKNQNTFKVIRNKT